MALALFTLLLQGSGAAYEMAEVLDKQLLQHLATSAAFSGLMLAALTSWGYFRYWWVLTKLAITLTQLYVGIFILSPRLNAVESGDLAPLIAASGLMASAMAFQAWLSVAKPWRAPIVSLLIALTFPLWRRRSFPDHRDQGVMEATHRRHTGESP